MCHIEPKVDARKAKVNECEISNISLTLLTDCQFATLIYFACEDNKLIARTASCDVRFE